MSHELMLALCLLVVSLLQVGAVLWCGVTWLRSRDAEWKQWALDRGITCGFPDYGYRSKT